MKIHELFEDGKKNTDPLVGYKNLPYDVATGVGRYTSTGSDDPRGGHGSSQNVNNYLRNLSGDKRKGIQSHSEEKVSKAISDLERAFTPENTNRKPIMVYTGIPQRIGLGLMKKQKGEKIFFPGFTSASFDIDVAIDFAKRYKRAYHDEWTIHICRFLVPEGQAVSPRSVPGYGVSLTNYPDEDEVILNYGMSAIYDGYGKRDNDEYDCYIYTLGVLRDEPTPMDYMSDYEPPTIDNGPNFYAPPDEPIAK